MSVDNKLPLSPDEHPPNTRIHALAFTGRGHTSTAFTIVRWAGKEKVLIRYPNNDEQWLGFWEIMNISNVTCV